MKLQFKKAVRTVTKFCKDHSSEILTGLGVGGLIASVVLTVPATVKATKHVEEVKKDLEVDKLPVKDVIKETWKYYIPPFLTAAGSTAALIKSCKEGVRKTAAITTAFEVADQTLKEYKEEAKELLGPKKASDLDAKVAERHVENNPPHDIFITGNGDTLYRDSLSGRYFRSDRSRIEKAVNTINFDLMNYNSMTLNDFYGYLGLEGTLLGRELGWVVDNGLLEVMYVPVTCETTNEPCHEISFNINPLRTYEKWW